MTIFLTSKTLLAIVLDHHTMRWHHQKEEYICEKLFGKQPNVKGAMIGEVDDQVWAIRTRGFYSAVDDPETENKLYILRLVAEELNLQDSELQVEWLKAVLQAAQHEAAEWKLGHVELWNPEARVKDLIERTGIEFRVVEGKKRENSQPVVLWWCP